MKRLLIAVGLACLTIQAAHADGRIVQWDRNLPPGTIVISTSTRKLNLVLGDSSAIQYPIAVGRAGAQWTGTTWITHKRWRPEWRPTPRMRRENPSLPAVVKPGRGNPLGVAALYLAEGLLRIHGTNDPKSIGNAASSGCFRMYNEDVSELYDLVQPGAVVIVEP